MLGKYNGRLAEFSVKGDEELAGQASQVIKLGRRTIFELMFLEGCFVSLSNKDGAVVLLNTHISSMDTQKVSQEDIEANLWQYVSRVLKGDTLM